MSEPFVLKEAAANGFSDASLYDQHRPSYPSEAVDKLLDYLRVATVSSSQIIDLGSGTGKFTELLVARPEKFEVIAVEPHEEMRGTLVKKNLGVKILDGNAAKMPVEDGWADALIVAQAFHWFATEETLKEIHRVLRLGASLGLIWNIEDYNAPKSWKATTPWEQKLKDVFTELEDGQQRFRDMNWKNIFEDQQLHGTPLQTLKDTLTHHLPMFSLPLGEDTIKWTVFLSDEGVWSRYSTLSQIANLDATKKDEVRKRVFDALKGEDVERNGKGEVAVHGVTYMAWTSRI